jgi:hypothetical protein
LPNGKAGVWYGALIGTTSQANWSIVDGALPAGLTLSANGVISGTPTATGTSTFTVKAANAAGNDTKEFTIVIGDVLELPPNEPNPDEEVEPIISAAPLKANLLKAWMQSGTLHLSGLTAGKTWSIYNAKGTMVRQGIASGAEESVKLNAVSGVYFVKSNGQILRIVNK